MYLFFKSVAEAVVDKGLRNLVGLIPGAAPLYEIAESAWKKYRACCKDAQNAQQMKDEGKLIERLLADGPHANIVSLIDADVDGEVPWLMSWQLSNLQDIGRARGCRQVPSHGAPNMDSAAGGSPGLREYP